VGFLRRLLSRQPTQSATQLQQVDAWIIRPSRPEAVLEVVGEASYQPALTALGGGRSEDGARVREHVALLIPEQNNPWDENAIAVQIAGHVVGYLPRENAVAYQPVVRWALDHGRYVASEALLTGGWDRGPEDQGTIGVILHLGSPTESMVDLLDDDHHPGDVSVGSSGIPPTIRRQPGNNRNPEQFSLIADHRWVGQMIAFTGDSRCIVGGVALDRSSCERLATRAGMTVYPRVTKRVQLLVDCDDKTVSGNQHKAIEYGIPVIAERDFWIALGLSVDTADWRSGR
jgi:hypothetical protein